MDKGSNLESFNIRYSGYSSGANNGTAWYSEGTVLYYDFFPFECNYIIFNVVTVVQTRMLRESDGTSTITIANPFNSNIKYVLPNTYNQLSIGIQGNTTIGGHSYEWIATISKK